jgi:hypothetical protein
MAVHLITVSKGDIRGHLKAATTEHLHLLLVCDMTEQQGRLEG